MKKGKSDKITALDRKVNRPRLGLRTAKTSLSHNEKCLITVLFWAAETRLHGIDNLNPAMLGFNFGGMYSTTGWQNLSPKTLQRLRQYLKKYSIKDWTSNER